MSLATITTTLSSVRQKLSECFSVDLVPTGYRPGVTLEHVRRNLGLARFASTGPTSARASFGDADLQVEIVERTESQLLMHLVMTEFSICTPALHQGSARFELHHTGAVRRAGIHCRLRAGDAALKSAVQSGLTPGSDLYRAVMPLDFKRLRIDLRDGKWTVRLEHMGGTEVVSRMPAFRRYIALSHEQRERLFDTLVGLQRLLCGM